MRRVALGLAVLLVLSGCSTPFGGEGGDDKVGTVTPAPLPAGSDGPPGVDLQRNTIDPSSLVTAHEQAIENGTVATSYQARRWQISNRTFAVEVRGQPIASDGRTVNETFVRTSDPTTFYHYSNDTAGYTYGTWANGTYTVRFVDIPGGISRTVSPSSSTPDQSFDYTKAATLRVWFNNTQVQTIDRVETPAGVRYRVTATTDNRGILGSGADRTHNSVDNGTLTATIRPDGLVTDLQLAFTLITRAGNLRTAYRYSATTDIERFPRPAWVDRSFRLGNQSLDS